jgi:hypothetical protein
MRAFRNNLELMTGVAVRIIAILAKFGLLILVGFSTGKQGLGDFALGQGAAVIYCKMAGFGLFYYMSRLIVGFGVRKKFGYLRSQYKIYVFANSILFAPIFWVFHYYGFSLNISLVLTLVLILEFFCNEIHLSLLANGRSKLANYLFSIRITGWLFICLFTYSLNKEDFSLIYVYSIWLIVLALQISWIVYLYRRFLMKKNCYSVLSLLTELRLGGLPIIIKYYIVSNLNVVAMYADRYLIAIIFGLEKAGIYSVFWSVGNAVFSIVGNSVHYSELNNFLKNAKSGCRSLIISTINSVMIKTLFVWLILSVPVVLIYHASIHYLDFMDGYSGFSMLLISILISVLFKLFFDVWVQAGYSSALDRAVITSVILVFVAYWPIVLGMFFNVGIYGAPLSYGLVCLLGVFLLKRRFYLQMGF